MFIFVHEIVLDILNNVFIFVHEIILNIYMFMK